MLEITYPNIKKIVILSIFITILFSCKSDDSAIVPGVIIDYELNLTSELANLGVGMYVTITKSPKNKEFSVIDYHNPKFSTKTIAQRTNGNGIIIYRKDFYDYQVFDLTCTYRSFEDYCQLKVDSKNNYIFVCPCCGSEFIVTADGMPTNTSKAYKPLMQYVARIEGNMLIISNE
ncbi:MAG TPA: hypothetical protein PLD12_02435 [Bacteroidales bacterium]|nr:hypothetical protein [Bacteroidales bacterium]HPO65282.1 hypothetical protein [Bacteroidales bacterium]